ncbi:MAG: hypothetical protein LBI03_02950 [Clostridiales bacterium]|nr:hypothetical protein [Clostridiales bacterium]
MNKLTVQEFATLLRDIAYADVLSHHLEWSLSVIHPKTNDGDVGYSGGIWCNHNFKHKKDISVSFSFSEIRGIHQFKFWIDRCETRFDFVKKDGKINIEDFKELMIKEFGIEKLYQHN